MIDPVTAIGVASAAFKGLKTAVAAGRELQDCVGQLGRWAEAIADLDKAEQINNKKKNSFFGKMIPNNGKSVQQQAIEIFTAKQQAKKQRAELRELIQWTIGREGWEDFIRIETDIRKQRREEVHAAIERKENIKEAILATVILVLFATIIFGSLWLFAELKGK